MDAVMDREEVREDVRRADVTLARRVAEFYQMLRDLGVQEPSLSASTAAFLDRALMETEHTPLLEWEDAE